MSKKLKTLGALAAVAAGAFSTVPTASALTLPELGLASTDACASLTMSTPFRAWGDLNPYVLSDGGTMEDPRKWILGGGATFISDQEPFKLAGRGTKSLRLPMAGASAMANFSCTGSAYPTMRFMVRNIGSSTAKLDVMMTATGVPVALKIASITAGSKWAPSPIIQVPTALLPLGVTGVQVVFVANGTGPDFRIDDSFVDPRRRL